MTAFARKIGPAASAILVAIALTLSTATAQTNCEGRSAPLSPVEPQRVTVQEVIQKAAANDSHFKAARSQYTYTQEVRIQTLRYGVMPGDLQVDGEFRQIAEVGYDTAGRRAEHVTFAPQTTLRRITLTPDDFDDIYNFTTFVFTAEDLPKYNVHYAGLQHVDELDTYVLDVAPRTIQPKKRYFQGRIWVDTRDLAVVKTCGKSVPDVLLKNKKKGQENLHPTFVTYREQFDDKYWFPTYTRSDDILRFRNNEVRIRQIIKYTDYAPSDARQRTGNKKALQQRLKP
jgi:hypothetical protein